MKKLIILVILIGILTGCSKNNYHYFSDDVDNVFANTNQGVIENKTVDIFEFTNTSLVWENNLSILNTTITNTSDDDVKIKHFLIHVSDSNGEVLTTLTGYVGSIIKGHQSTVLNAYCYMNLTDAFEVTYEVVE